MKVNFRTDGSLVLIPETDFESSMISTFFHNDLGKNEHEGTKKYYMKVLEDPIKVVILRGGHRTVLDFPDK